MIFRLECSSHVPDINVWILKNNNLSKCVKVNPDGVKSVEITNSYQPGRYFEISARQLDGESVALLSVNKDTLNVATYENNIWTNRYTLVTKSGLSSFLDVVTVEYSVTLSANQGKITSGSVTIKKGYTPLPKMLSVRIAGTTAIRITGDNYYTDGKIYVFLENTTTVEQTVKVSASVLCYKS